VARLSRSVIGLAVVAAVALGCAALAATAGAFVAADGIRVVSVQRVDARLLALEVYSRALGSETDLRILLPSRYAAGRRYPVLYLLDGTSGSAADWTTAGDAEQTTAGRPFIVVMPDIDVHGNGGGWCTDSVNGAIPDWETYHVDELIPWVDANLPTVAGRAGRAIAGLSQGGFCAMSYAARYPDLFGTALSFSGAPDIAYDAQAQAIVTPVIEFTASELDGVAPDSMFGPRATDEINWAAHDPATLAANLRDTRLYLYVGDGRPGPLDTGPTSPGETTAEVVEAGAERLTELFHQRLDALGIRSYYDDYGPGTHSWPYWARDLQASIGFIGGAFAHPLAPPRRLTYTSADPAYSEYGWRVVTHRRVREFSTLRDAGADGFAMQGSGSASVTTPALYTPGAACTVSVNGAARRIVPGPAGRLTVGVRLGRSDTVQEFPRDGAARGTVVHTAGVRISGCRR
jgi:S-formylglutathione hydrolase FrmB